MEALATRERIFGSNHVALIDPIEEAGDDFADNGKYFTCIQLWLYALKICHNTDSRFSTDRFADLFAEMLDLGLNLQFECVLDVFEHVITQVELDIARIAKGHEDTDSLQRSIRIYGDNVLGCLYLIGIMLERSDSESKKVDLSRVVYKLVCLNPKVNNGHTLLHMYCTADTRPPRYTNEFRMNNIFTFPDNNICKTLIECGASVNAQDDMKNTPLQVIASCADACLDFDTVYHKTILCLVENGAHLDACNEDGETAVDVATTNEVVASLKAHTHINLLCLASRAMKRHRVNCKDISPRHLHEYIELH